MSSPLFKKPP